MSLPLVAILVVDTRLVGGKKTLENLTAMVSALPSVSCAAAPTILVYDAAVIPPWTLKTRVVATLRGLHKKGPRFLFLGINGHSKLYKGADAQEMATGLGCEVFVMNTGPDARFSCLVSETGSETNKAPQSKTMPVLTPIDMKEILFAIPPNVKRTLVFLDTCHSMSLVSVLVVPPIDIRIIHSTGEEEKTWQTEAGGSVMSATWLRALMLLCGEPRRRDPRRRDPRRVRQGSACCVGLDEEMRKASVQEAICCCTSGALQSLIKIVASLVRVQVLTTGPGQGLTVY